VIFAYNMKMLTKCSCLAVDSSTIAEAKCKSRVVLDVREPSSYEKSHIKDSVNLITSNLLLRRLQRGSFDIKNLLQENILNRLDDIFCDTIVIYDEESSVENESRKLSVISSALKKGFSKKSVYILNGGFNEFCESYPLCCEYDYPVDHPNPFQIAISDQESSRDPTDRNVFSPGTDLCPVSILPHLFLGSAHHSSQKDLLDKLGVTAILNVSRSCPVLFRNAYEYKTISIDDNDVENISSHFDDAIKFIDDVKSKNGKVLVHCRAGISRSATICIAYLMRKYSYTLDQAYEYTKNKRSSISPNFNFLGQLLTLENEVLAKQTLGPNSPSLTFLSSPSDTPRAPLTSSLMNKTFTYPPNNCMSFFNISTPTTPYCALLTPS